MSGPAQVVAHVRSNPAYVHDLHEAFPNATDPVEVVLGDCQAEAARGSDDEDVLLDRGCGCGCHVNFIVARWGCRVNLGRLELQRGSFEIPDGA